MSPTNLEPSNPLSSPLNNASGVYQGPTTERAETGRRKFPKSRNGCVTCKARRVKCDETRPTCEQCARRRIPCGGYKIDVRWKQASEPKKKSSPKNHKRSNSSQDKLVSPNGHRLDFQAHTSTANDGNDVYSQGEQQLLSNDIESADMMSCVFAGSDTNSSSINLQTPPNFDSIFSNLHNVHHSSIPFGTITSPPRPDNNEIIEDVGVAPELWNMETFWEDYLRPLPTTPLDFGLEANASENIQELSNEREDEVGRIALLFHQQTCHTLSICEETDQNPWKDFVWPLVKDHPALYHAIAALTCICMSREKPQLRLEGSRHVRKSTDMLSENSENSETSLEAALAATLALGFAETWEYDADAGSHRIRDAGFLIHQLSVPSSNLFSNIDDHPRLDFLLRTFMYMDVLARFTCPELSFPGPDFPPTIDFEQLGLDPMKLDPLMGYATTFFPIMRRVADLINKVRRREASRNSPMIIAQALELRRVIESWNLPIDLETFENPSQNMTDAIQTAEAYRWSTLLTLYQAIPELPNLTSYGELAQKVLVYLATIPLTSTTVIVHIFPLMVAGCDAVEEEDREFVRDRWNAMSKRMVTAVVERCLKITEELWRRREEYLVIRGLSFSANGRRIDTSTNEGAALSSDIANFLSIESSPGAYTTSSGGQSNSRIVRKGNDFPISAAFKKGVDMLTRSGFTEYTVRGRLHWLGVMKDWNWQVMLG